MLRFARTVHRDTTECFFVLVLFFVSITQGPLECGAFSRCEKGHYCTNGVKFPCPAGSFGSSLEETSHLCSGPCPAGFFCPEGSSRLVLVRVYPVAGRCRMVKYVVQDRALH